MTIRIERGDLDRWVATMDRAASKAPGEATRVVAKGALNIKTDARGRIGRSRHAPAYPESIGYDIWQGLRGPVAEIGPDKLRRQGALGNLLEYGSVHNPPHPHMIPAAEAEQPRFERAMGELAERLLEGR